jgi:tRNA threonylcarbamoyladenosine biosynthesis protein TsaB
VAGHEGVLASAHSSRGQRHAESLAPMIKFVCAQADIELSDLGAIAVDVGPGLFTGLRVGISTAKAMAYALQIPMVPVSSLDLLAFPVRNSNRLIAAIVDARRGEVFQATYRQVPGGVQQITEPSVSAPRDLAGELMASADEALLVGDGARRYRDDFEELTNAIVADAGLAYPNAGSLVQLAHAQAVREEFMPHWELQPVYLRKPDAEINWDTRESAPRSGDDHGQAAS